MILTNHENDRLTPGGKGLSNPQCYVIKRNLHCYTIEVLDKMWEDSSLSMLLDISKDRNKVFLLQDKIGSFDSQHSLTLFYKLFHLSYLTYLWQKWINKRNVRFILEKKTAVNMIRHIIFKIFTCTWKSFYSKKSHISLRSRPIDIWFFKI